MLEIDVPFNNHNVKFLAKLFYLKFYPTKI